MSVEEQRAAEGALERVPTGVAGLDTLLYGGLLRGGSYLVQGSSGVGKTVLANQISFHHVRAGGRVVYVTMLAEEVGRLLQNLSSFRFFDRDRVGRVIHYLGAFRELQAGREALLQHILEVLRKHEATLLVLDGVSAAEEWFGSLEWRLILHEIRAGADLLGCTSLYLLPSEPGPVRPEHTVVEGILNLHFTSTGPRTERQIEVRKSRGSRSIAGRHSFDIGERGIRIYPRLESLDVLQHPAPGPGAERVPTGAADLDAMIRGGLAAGSSTLVLGAAGTGKTTIGLQFLIHGAERGEPVLHFGFYEPPGRLLAKAESLGWPLGRYVDDGLAEICWQLPTESLLDRLGEDLLEHVERRKVTRCFIDGLDALRQASLHSARLSPFMTALMNGLRNLGVTVMMSAESPGLLGSGLEAPVHGISPLVENLLLLRHVEHQGRIAKLLGVVKTRDDQHDGELCELVVGPDGLRIVRSFEGAEALLTGIAFSRSPTVERGPAA